MTVGNGVRSAASSQGRNVMETHLKVLHVDAASGFYKIERFEIGRFFGPVDLGAGTYG